MAAMRTSEVGETQEKLNIGSCNLVWIKFLEKYVTSVEVVPFFLSEIAWRLREIFVELIDKNNV
jgi:hypothetical protein